MEFIEFDFDSFEGKTLTIHGQSDNGKVYFKAFCGPKRISKGMLTSIDILNIEEFIRENAESDEDVLDRENDD